MLCYQYDIIHSYLKTVHVHSQSTSLTRKYFCMNIFIVILLSSIFQKPKSHPEESKNPDEYLQLKTNKEKSY